MARKTIEVRLTVENCREALQAGDVIVEAEELGQVVSARPCVRPEDGIMIYFMGGDCAREQFGPQTLRVEREVGAPEHEWRGRPLGTHVMVEMSKVGGGTVGRRYSGRWSYRITQNGKVVAEGEDMNTPKVVTHEEAARIAWGFQDEAYAAELYRGE
jgi:hypothetical protein